MAENDVNVEQRSINPGGPLQDGVRVPIASEVGAPMRVTLEDGTELSIKPSVIEAFRFTNAFDISGLPIYQIKAGLVTSVDKVRDELKRK